MCIQLNDLTNDEDLLKTVHCPNYYFIIRSEKKVLKSVVKHIALLLFSLILL